MNIGERSTCFANQLYVSSARPLSLLSFQISGLLISLQIRNFYYDGLAVVPVSPRSLTPLPLRSAEFCSELAKVYQCRSPAKTTTFDPFVPSLGRILL